MKPDLPDERQPWVHPDDWERAKGGPRWWRNPEYVIAAFVVSVVIFLVVVTGGRYLAPGIIP